MTATTEVYDYDRLLERLDAVYAFVPLNQYDEVTKLAERELALLLARLTTAEQERDSYRDGEKAANEALERNIKRARAAEARVEALLKARDQAQERFDRELASKEIENRSLGIRMKRAEDYVASLHGAERFERVVEVQARVEAAERGLKACHGDREQFRVRAGIAEEALREIVAATHKPMGIIGNSWYYEAVGECSSLARAALACPPQQREMTAVEVAQTYAIARGDDILNARPACPPPEEEK